MKKFLCEVSEELLAAVDAARGPVPRNPWIEAQLWKLRVIRDAARAEGIAKPNRPDDGRGGARPRRPDS
jgi:hypothetical protein